MDAKWNTLWESSSIDGGRASLRNFENSSLAATAYRPWKFGRTRPNNPWKLLRSLQKATFIALKPYVRYPTISLCSLFRDALWSYLLAHITYKLLFQHLNLLNWQHKLFVIASSSFRNSLPKLCKIWGFHSGDYEECRLLGCGTVQILCEQTFLRNVGSHKMYTAPHPRRRHSSSS
jgi:hypothetical protein